MTGTLCVLCIGEDKDKRQQEVGYSCRKCMSWMDDLLRQIEDYAAGLSAERGRSAGGRRAPGFSSTSPARDEVLVALDYRSHGGASVHLLRDPTVADDEPIRSLLGGLNGMAEWVRDLRGFTPEPSPTIASEVRFLRTNLDWCVRQTKVNDDGEAIPWIDDLADDLRELRSQVRALNGFRPSRAGTCGYLTKQGECGGQMYSYEDFVKCRSCGREIDRKNWLRAEDMAGGH